MRNTHRTHPVPRSTIEISIIMTVAQRENYEKQIERINNFVLKQFPELKFEYMSSPVKVSIKIK